MCKTTEPWLSSLGRQSPRVIHGPGSSAPGEQLLLKIDLMFIALANKPKYLFLQESRWYLEIFEDSSLNFPQECLKKEILTTLIADVSRKINFIQ